MSRSSVMRTFAAASTLIVVAAVAGAIAVLGSPAEQRLRRFDEQRLRDLSSIENSIAFYATTHSALPPDLAALGAQPGPQPAHSDPETGAAYEYDITDANAYKLCATFSRASDGNNTFTTWNHGAGYQCFDRKQRTDKN